MPRIASGVIILLAALSLAAAATASAAPPYAAETPIASGPGSQQSADLGSAGSGPLVTWEDDASGVWHIGAQWAGQPVASPAAAGSQRHPAEYQDCIVYEDDRNGDWDLYRSTVSMPGFPLPADQDVPFATGAGDQLDPAVYGDAVVYESDAAGNWDIYARSISTGVERRLTSDSASQVDPAICGSRVVWADHRNGNWDIYGIDLTTGRTTRLTSDPDAQRAPQIKDARVVYQDHRNGNWDIYERPFSTGSERRLTTDPHDQTAPSIGDDRTVVYEDHRTAGPHVSVCDLRTGVNRPVTDGAAAQTAPKAADDTVVWTDERSGDPDVYSCILVYPSLSLKAPAATPDYGATVHITGRLAFESPPPAKTSVSLRIGSTRHILPVHAWDADSEGTFSSAFAAVRKVVVTASYADPTQLPAAPQSVTVLPKALLTRPALKMGPRPANGALIAPRALIASGVLRPRHKPGSAAVIIEIWQKGLFQDWKLIKSVKVKVHDEGAFSAYGATVLAHAAPGWDYRVRAIHSDADHARTESAFSSIVHP